MEGQPVKWPATDVVMARLQRWLEETRGEASRLGDASEPHDPGEPQVGLYQFVEHLTSLRHEVKLLTKASRNGEDRTESTLLSMQAAIEQFRAVETSKTQVAEQAVRPIVEVLADLDQSLGRGRRVIEDARRRMLEEAAAGLSQARECFEQLYRSQPWWRRVLCRPWHAAVQDVYGTHRLDTARGFFDALLEGYQLIQTRLQRAMDEQGILRMQCLGRIVDPHCMTVIETVSDPCRPPGLVIEEVRTGYYWKSKVFRFAEVRTIGER